MADLFKRVLQHPLNFLKARIGPGSVQTGWGLLFFGAVIYAFWVSFIFWGRKWDANLLFLSKQVCANGIEWVFFAFVVPGYFWFWEKNKKISQIKLFRKQLFLSQQLALLIQNSKYGPIVLEKGKFGNISLSEIFSYMKDLAQIGILRQVPVGENRYQFFSAEKILKKKPVRPIKFIRIYNFYFFSFLISFFVFSAISAVLSTTLLQNWSHANISAWAVGLAPDVLIQIGPDSSLRGIWLTAILIFVLIMAIRFENLLSKQWQKWQNQKRERKFFRFVRKNNGLSNSMMVTLTMGIPLTRARQYLDYLQGNGLAQKEYEETGLVFYKINK